MSIENFLERGRINILGGHYRDEFFPCAVIFQPALGLLNLELPLCLGHESRIAQRGEKENAKPQQSIS
jgi:hypothetical protein